MVPETGSDVVPETVPDPADLIVGTIHPPAWVGRIPAAAWLFIALAVVDAGDRVWRTFGSGPGWVTPDGLALFLAVGIAAVARVLLPAAIVVGCRNMGRAGDHLVQGGVALAVAELLNLAGPGVVRSLAGSPMAFDGPSSGVAGVLGQSLAILVPTAILSIFGLIRIASGLRAIAVARRRPLGRLVVVALVASMAMFLAGEAATLQASNGEVKVDGLVVISNVFAAATGLVTIALWAWITTLAARRGALTWRAVMAGAGSAVLGAGILGACRLLAFAIGSAEVQGTLTWIGLVGEAISATGAGLLVVAFSRGFRPVGDPSTSERGPGDLFAGDDAPRTASS